MTIKHFGNKQENEIYRRTVVAVLYDKQTKEYVYEYWPTYYNLATLISGGVEDREELEGAMKREIIEETGYIDFTIVDRLGDDIYSHYYQASKGAYYVKHITAYFVLLESSSRVKQELENDEKFIIKQGKFDEVMLSFNNYNPPNESSVDDQIEILHRGARYVSENY